MVPVIVPVSAPVTEPLPAVVPVGGLNGIPVVGKAGADPVRPFESVGSEEFVLLTMVFFSVRRGC